LVRFQYEGPGPFEIRELDGTFVDLIRPGDVREYDIEPPFGPWERLDPETDEGDQPGPPGASPAATSAAPALTLPPVKDM
jgi:hypothetical protein